MIQESYQGFSIKTEGPVQVPSRRAWRCWFQVTPADDELADPFTFEITITERHALQSSDGRSVETLVMEEGKAWVHGLIDLGRVQLGVTETQLRTPEWEPMFGEADLEEDQLRQELLEALRRQEHAIAVRMTGTGIDVDGIAAVLGIRPNGLRGVLNELIREGLAEPYAGAFGRPPESGRCRITGEGLRALRATPARPSLIYVDDIDSFAGVKNVSAEQVSDVLTTDGLLQVPEAQVKQVFLQIIGEPFEDKDWGGERSDVFSTRVILAGRRVPTAMLLKGPAVGRVLYPAGLGKRGDQDLRLFTEPADLFVVQFVGKIDSAVIQRLRTQVSLRTWTGLPTTVCVIDGVDTARVFRAYGFI